MTRSTINKLKEPLEEPEREMHRLRKSASRQQRNESLVIARRNLFNNKASSSANSGPKPMSPLKSMREHSSPNSAGDIYDDPSLLRFYQNDDIPPWGNLKKHKKDDDDERLLSIFRQIHVNLPFLEAMIHMPNGAKVDTFIHDGKWIKAEEEHNLKEIRAVSFYPRPEQIEPLEWKVSENRLKPSITEPSKLELKELSEHLE
ncbi:hypothetical protein Tco_0184225 [Tanacetum coccineum]